MLVKEAKRHLREKGVQAVLLVSVSETAYFQTSKASVMSELDKYEGWMHVNAKRHKNTLYIGKVD